MSDAFEEICKQINAMVLRFKEGSLKFKSLPFANLYSVDLFSSCNISTKKKLQFTIDSCSHLLVICYSYCVRLLSFIVV